MKILICTLFISLFASSIQSQIEISVATDKCGYLYGQDLEISITAWNSTSDTVELKFSTLCQARYFIDNMTLSEFCATVPTERTIPPLSSFTWVEIHNTSLHPIAPGMHYITGEVIGYGRSEPIFIRVLYDPILQMPISVATDTNTYSYGQMIRIFVTANNPTADTMRLEFTTSYQSTYYIDNYYPNPIVLPVLTGRIILPDSSYTWEHEHTWSNFPIEPGPHQIIGEVIGYGKSDPVFIWVDPGSAIEALRTTRNHFKLSQNYPNPFNPGTTIEFSIPHSCHVALKIYDVQGREKMILVDETLASGTHQVKLDARHLASGICFYKIQAGDFTQIKKMVLME